jgi:lysophospholipase L1-like esterase
MPPQSIAFFGSSSVYAMHDSTGSGYVGRFRAWCQHQQFNSVVYNLGIPGETTHGLIKRFLNEFNARNPELVVFHMGANDSSHLGQPTNPNRVGSEEFTANTETLIYQVKELAQICIVSPIHVNEDKNPHLGETYYFNADIELYTAALEKIAEKYELPFLNIFNRWQVADQYKNFLSPDGLHLNDAGHEALAKHFAVFFKENYL